jgi:hypothetical protein
VRYTKVFISFHFGVKQCKILPKNDMKIEHNRENAQLPVTIRVTQD